MYLRAVVYSVDLLKQSNLVMLRLAYGEIITDNEEKANHK